MSDASKLTPDLLDAWAIDSKGPVALHVKQRLLAVEGDDDEPQVIYPPTYADIGYNIDRLSDGTKVALIDSVGSQANRLEPAFKPESENLLSGLIPQIEIVLRTDPCGKCDSCLKAKGKPKAEKCEDPWKEKRSLLDLAHRAADAVVQSSPTLLPVIESAFETLRKTGNAAPLCTIAPTSLIFGCWDSRGGSGEKRPRLVRSIIRAWDIDPLSTAAQFNSVWKALDEEQREGLRKALPKGSKLSEKGFNDAPSSGPGGIVVLGQIQRDVTVNLVAVRGLRGESETQTKELRRYLLAISLLTATTDIDLFLREGCNLRFAEAADEWFCVPRRGEKTRVDLNSEDAQKTLREYAAKVAKPFQNAFANLQQDDAVFPLEHNFDLATAKKLLAKKDESEGNS